MENLTYDEMLEKTNSILICLERDQLSVQDLSKKLEEAYVLIEKLKQKLFEAEVQVEQIINSRKTANILQEDNHGS